MVQTFLKVKNSENYHQCAGVQRSVLPEVRIKVSFSSEQEYAWMHNK